MALGLWISTWKLTVLCFTSRPLEPISEGLVSKGITLSFVNWKRQVVVWQYGFVGLRPSQHKAGIKKVGGDNDHLRSGKSVFLLPTERRDEIMGFPSRGSNLSYFCSWSASVGTDLEAHAASFPTFPCLPSAPKIPEVSGMCLCREHSGHLYKDAQTCWPLRPSLSLLLLGRHFIGFLSFFICTCVPACFTFNTLSRDPSLLLTKIYIAAFIRWYNTVTEISAGKYAGLSSPIVNPCFPVPVPVRDFKFTKF